MGFVGDINYNANFESFIPNDFIEDIEGKLKKLYDCREYAKEYEPEKKWIDETIDYLEQSRDSIKSEDKMSKIT